MIIVSEVGSACDIGIQGKYPLFSETQFDTIMIEDGFERKIDAKNNNQPFFQKGDIIIFSTSAQNTITLRLRNTISLQTKYNEFSKLLAKLSFRPEHIALLGGKFSTFVTGVGDPVMFLDHILNVKTKTALADKLNIKPGILSVVIGNTDVTQVDMQIRIEPLATNPKESLFMEFIFRTVKYEAFNEFIGKFGADFIKEIIATISEANDTNS